MRDAWIAAGLCGLLAAGLPAIAAAATPCPSERNCAAIAVQAPAEPVAPGNTVLIRLAFTQGVNDQQAGGVDEVAALTATVGIPGLQLADCSAPGADGLNPSFALPSSEPGRYRVIVQNLTCAKRATCLCPSGGEARDEYVNLLVLGTPGAAGIQSLPNGGLLDIALRVPSDLSGMVGLHLYSPLDDPGTRPRPAASAELSIADAKATDLTVESGSDTMNVRITDGELTVSAPPSATATATATATDTPLPPATATATATETPPNTATATAPATATATIGVPGCVGDCNGSGEVTVSELIAGVSIALGSAPLSTCPAFDCTGSGQVEVSCLVAAVNAALGGCPQ